MHGRFFYGWLIVAAPFVILTLAYGLQFSYGVFLPHIMADLNLDRASASAPFSLYVVFYTFWSIVTGPATDRFGPRKVVIIGGLLLALGYFLLSSATEGWQLFLYFGAIAGAGMSAAYIPLNATVVRWFDQRRGLALAITGTGSNAAVLLLPMLSALLIPVLGWRDALLILGLGGSGVIICCALTLVRDPSAKNLAPDGQTVDQGVEGTPAGVQQASLTLAQARAEPALWIIMGVFFFTWVMTFFPYVHLPSLAADLGYDPARAASLVVALGIGGISGRAVIGWLSDRFSRIHSLHAGLLFQVLASVIYIVSDDLLGLYPATMLFAAGVSAAITLFPAIIADIFGAKHVGAIAGFAFALAGTGTAIGPYLAGLIKDTSGSYLAAFLIMASMNCAAIALLAMLPDRRQP